MYHSFLTLYDLLFRKKYNNKMLLQHRIILDCENFNHTFVRLFSFIKLTSVFPKCDDIILCVRRRLTLYTLEDAPKILKVPLRKKEDIKVNQNDLFFTLRRFRLLQAHKARM